MEIFNPVGTVFFVGIKGAAMANLAVILQKMGVKVVGSDTEEVFITDKTLADNSIHVFNSFDTSVIPTDTKVLVYSAAHGGQKNQQVMWALNNKIPVMHQSELIALILKQFVKSIAVCGTHGKTTTSAFITHALSRLGAQPSYMVGTSSFSGVSGGDYCAKPFFVVEADEYAIDPPRDKRAKFLMLEPKFIVATNIDFDHPDVYENIEDTKNTFDKFFRKIAAEGNEGKLILNADDPHIMSLSGSYPKKYYETYGFSKTADLQIISFGISESSTLMSLEYRGKPLGEFGIKLFGGGHVANTAAVILTLLNLGYSSEEIRGAIADFTGAKRRFEFVKKVGECYLFDDYAHHPSEIKATIATAKARFPNKRIVIIFQPHTYSRTQSLENEFIQAFRESDLVFLSPIFASARENQSEGAITSIQIAAKAGSSTLAYSSKRDLINKLDSQLRRGDIIFTMGAGDVYKLKEDVIELLESKFNSK